MPDLNQLLFIIFVSSALAFIIAIGSGTVFGEQIWLGDEVTTSDRYTEIFNDSFTGNVVMTGSDGVYTVRDDNGTERAIEKTWLRKISAEEI